MPDDKARIAAEIIEQFDSASRYYQQNYFNEFAEIYRSIKCRVEVKKDKLGKEIKNRTNVALPDHFVMRRKKVARLTAQAPNLRVRGGTDQAMRDKVTALAYRQWDLGGWQKVFRQMVDQCGVFGWSVSKTSWTKAVIYKKLRRRTVNLNRPQLMMLQGAPADEILDAEQNNIELTEEERIGAIGQYGPEVSLRLPVTKYEGPIGERVFIGDLFPEPGFKALQQSAYVIEYSERDMAWLDYWAKVTGTNPDTGEEGPIFDAAVVAKVKEGIDSKYAIPRRVVDLRRELREAIRISDPTVVDTDNRLRGERFPIYERHSIMRDGRIRIDWCYDKDMLLGSQLYPWDTYGKYIYNELVLIPDLLGGIGDSTIRSSRFLMQMKNTHNNQITDFQNRLLRPKMLRNSTCEVKEEDYEREGFSEMVVSEINGIKPLDDPRFPGEAYLHLQTLNREIQQTEPLINDFSPGTEAIPQTGKLATTAIFQQKSADSIVADELRQIDMWLYDVENLNLAMAQQSMQEKITVEAGFHERVDAMTCMNNGDGSGVRSIQIDPLEIQQDLEIFPETGSTLAADDEFKTSKIMQGYIMAKSDPVNFNVKAFAKKIAQTIPGMSITEAIMPDVKQEQLPEIKVSLSINYKDLPPDVQASMLSKLGFPVAGTMARGTLESVVKLGEAAEAAFQAESSGEEESDTVKRPKAGE